MGLEPADFCGVAGAGRIALCDLLRFFQEVKRRKGKCQSASSTLIEFHFSEHGERVAASASITAGTAIANHPSAGSSFGCTVKQSGEARSNRSSHPPTHVRRAASNPAEIHSSQARAPVPPALMRIKSGWDGNLAEHTDRLRLVLRPIHQQMGRAIPQWQADVGQRKFEK